MEAPTREAELGHRTAPGATHGAASGPDRLLTRREASSHLREHGFPVAEATLATKATRGGGPPYSLFGRRALYRAGDLLDWARAAMTAPRRSTSEADAARGRRRGAGPTPGAISDATMRSAPPSPAGEAERRGRQAARPLGVQRQRTAAQMAESSLHPAARPAGAAKPFSESGDTEDDSST